VGLGQEREDFLQFLGRGAALVRGPQQDIEVGAVKERSEAATANGFDDGVRDLSAALDRSGGGCRRRAR
jgi:hypothetical protein